MAYESRKYSNGIFFHHLLEGLQVKAANKKGEVVLESLIGYVKGEMADTLLEEFGPDAHQRPQVVGAVSTVELKQRTETSSRAVDRIPGK